VKINVADGVGTAVGTLSTIFEQQSWLRARSCSCGQTDTCSAPDSGNEPK
jgi:hypothetical protein